MSNSSLSKTFALCQFRKLKLQKLCFLPPNIVLGVKKMSPKIILGQKKFWSWKKFGPKKNVGSEKKWFQKSFWVRKNLGLKNFLVQKNFGSKKNMHLKKKFGSEKFLSKIFGCWSCSSCDMDPHPLDSAKSPWEVYASNFSLLVHPLLKDFGEGWLFFLFFLFFFLWQG